RAGWTEGWYGLVMSPRLMPRLAQLMLHDGVWNGERLLSHEFVRAAGSPTPTNGGYGYLMWTNRGDSYVTTEFPGRHLVPRPLIPSAPRDLYEFAGLGGQNLYIIPSLDIVIERSGENPCRDNARAYARGGGGDYEWELFRMLNRAVTDADWGDPGPFQPLEPASTDPGTLVDTEQGLAGLGVGARAGGCNLAGCDGRVDFSGFERQRSEIGGYVQGLTTRGVIRPGERRSAGWGPGHTGRAGLPGRPGGGRVHRRPPRTGRPGMAGPAGPVPRRPGLRRGNRPRTGRPARCSRRPLPPRLGRGTRPRRRRHRPHPG